MTGFSPQDVLDFWFPDDRHWTDMARHGAFWNARMHGEMDAEIFARFAGVTEAAARSQLDHWADTPRGRLALLIALDQFPRSLWRDTPAAFAQDIKAARLALDGIANGHFDALDHGFEKLFYVIAISHCEGPDHLARLDMLLEICGKIEAAQPPELDDFRSVPSEQTRKVRAVIAEFGRHPHRNAVLGRMSSPAEEAYIAEGKFPHSRQM